MKEEKDLERLFREHFKDFEAQPERDLWSGIEDRLSPSRKKRITPVLWWRMAGVAAVLGIAFFGARSFLFTPETISTPENQVTDTRDIQEVSTPDPQLPGTGNETPGEPGTSNNLNTIAQPVQKKTVVSSDDTFRKQENNNLNTTAISSQENGNTRTQATSEQFLTSYGLSSLAFDSKPEGSLLPEEEYLYKEASEEVSLLEYLEEREEENNKEAQLTERWAFNPSIAPVYYNTMKNGSPIEQSFNDNNKKGETHLSYGLNIAYQVNKKFSIRTGLNRVTMGYATDNVSFSPNTGPAFLSGNIEYSNNNLNIIINDLGRRPQNAFQSDVPKAGVVYDGSMIQRMGYLEVPLEFKYKMAGNRFGVHFIGGMSSLFLMDNKILLQSESINTEIGKASNINSTNFSTNLGIGLDYWFTNDLLLNLEPMFKYQWNTFSGEDGGFSPYLLGIYTGFSFRF